MSGDAGLETIREGSQRLLKMFNEQIEMYRPALWRYCRAVTGSPWDAEDLVQETLLRAFATLSRLHQPVVAKNYLFRIATNVWIDIRRKESNYKAIPLESTSLANAGTASSIGVRETIESMAWTLPPRQVVIVLLTDVFDFTASEVAEMIQSTEGAVKSALHRARTKLQTSRPEIAMAHRLSAPDRETWNRTVDAYVSAFDARDPDRLADLLAEHSSVDIIHASVELGKQTIRAHSFEHWAMNANPMRAVKETLWGRGAVLWMEDKGEGEELVNVVTLEVEDGLIIRMRGYFFCPEFLQAAGNALNLKVNPIGYEFRF